MQRKKSSKSEQESNKSSEDASRWKYIAFVVLFTLPGFMYAFESLSTISKNFNASSYMYTAVPAFVIIALWICFRTVFKGLHKYLLIFTLPLILFPSFKVYLCSPVVLRNKDIGTKYKLATTADEILQDCGESCLKAFSKSLYGMSFVTPRITFKVSSKEIYDFNATVNSVGSGGVLVKSSRVFIFVSLRSVRGKVHSLSMLVKVPYRSTKILEALEMKQNMELTGRLVNIGRDLLEIKAGYERQKLFVRPVVFEPYQFELLNEDDEL